MKTSLILILSLIISADVYAQDSSYLWPTNSGRFLSSTFGETRSAHFHAGLDIKTWGREGYKVFASKDGVLSQLLITNQGYGKAIYLKHNDGSYTVYAHLNRFNNEFQTIADSIRIQDYSYTFDKYLEPLNIKVKQGDVIGYTGSTGIGPPHLHFEIRNSENQPINPLQFNFDIRDTLAPVFSSVLIEPLQIDSRINGSVYPATVSPFEIRNDTTFFDTVFVKGKFGISPYVYDEANSVTNKYAVYKLSLILNDDTLYQEKVNSFDFSDSEKMFFNRIIGPQLDRRRFQRLFIEEDRVHPFLVKNTWMNNLNEGNYIIIAEDYFGNHSVAVIPIRFNTKPSKPYSVASESFEYWTNDWVSTNDSTNINLKDLKFGVLWDSKIDQRIINFKEDPNHTVSRIEPNRPYSIASPDFTIKSIIEPHTFFDTVSIVQNWDLKNDSIFIEIGNLQNSVRKNINLQIQLSNVYKLKSRTNLYSIDQNQEVKFVESWVSGSTLNASIGGLGNFVVLTDSTPPIISSPKRIILESGLNTYSIKTTDDLSGIDYSSAIVMVNNQRGIPEYDYENDTFTFYLPDFKPSKQDSIYIELKDRAGNVISKNFLLKN